MTSRGSFGDNFTSYQTGNQPARDSDNEFGRLSRAIASNVQKIKNNVANMERMVQQIESSSNAEDLRDRVHQTQHYTNQLAQETGKYIKDMLALPNGASVSEQRQRRMQKDRLANEFTTVLNQFQNIQREAAKREKEKVARARVSSQNDPFNEQQDYLVSLDSPTAGKTAQLQIDAEDVDLQVIREREEGIRKLESDIVDVNQIFKDLAMLVHEQQDVVDSIEANVENATVHVEEGRDQLGKAENYQSKVRKKKCICLILVLVALGVIGLIIGLSVRK